MTVAEICIREHPSIVVDGVKAPIPAISFSDSCVLDQEQEAIWLQNALQFPLSVFD